jgi:hypothetical protein
MNMLQVIFRGIATAFFVIGCHAAAASTITFDWSIGGDGDLLRGQIAGLLDNTENQSVQQLSFIESTFPIVGFFDIAEAKKNSDFNVINGQVVSGHLKFDKLGAGTIASPSISLEMKWRNGQMNTFTFEFDDGTKDGKYTLDFRKAGTLFSVAPGQPINPDVGTDPGLIPVPLPASGALLLAGLLALPLLRRMTKHGRSDRKLCA